MGLALVCGIMTLLWAVQLKTRNAGIVDVAWALSIPLLAVLYYGLGNVRLAAPEIMAVLMSLAWGLRLAWHIHRRGHGKPEEGRYADLRTSWGTNAAWKFFIFFQFQAVAGFIFSLPFLLVINDHAAALNAWQFIAVVLWLIAYAGESLSDRQLARFKADPASKGKVCEYGLWNYSRHPNYFFEWLIWVAFALFALTSPYGWIAIICPALMLFFLFKITGIPATEEQALRTRGDAYRRYQQTTSVFVPWFKRNN